MSYLDNDHSIFNKSSDHLELTYGANDATVEIIHFRGFWQTECAKDESGVTLCGGHFGFSPHAKITDKKVNCPKCIAIIKGCKKIKAKEFKIDESINVINWPLGWKKPWCDEK